MSYKPEKTNYKIKTCIILSDTNLNNKKIDSIFISELCYVLAGEFMVWCVAGRVWWAALCQKVQGHFFCPSLPLFLSAVRVNGRLLGEGVRELGLEAML